MSERPTEKDNDPTRALLRRFRTPALVLVAVVLTIGQVPKLASGDVFLVVTALLHLAFLASITWFVLRRRVQGSEDPAEIRRQQRPSLRFWGAWLAVAIVWLMVGFTVGRLRPPALLVATVPALGLATSGLVHAKAEALARRMRTHRERSGR